MDASSTVWEPAPEEAARTNIGRWMAEKGLRDYAGFHRWSATEREAFWQELLDRVGIRFRKRPARVLDPASDVAEPRWLPGAELNIVESCFQAEPEKTAIVAGREGSPDLIRWSYADLARQVDRVVRGLDAMGLGPRARVALYLPMTAEAVASYLGILKSGRSAVGIADASAPEELAKRLRIADVQAIVTMESYRREGKELRIYAKAKAAQAPRAVVLPPEGSASGSEPLRPGDIAWTDFLKEGPEVPAVIRGPEDETNVLFSSGTTKDPKAIVWTQTTPIKCVADGYLHHDVRPEDVVAWPTSFGWMMGPWLTFASLVNRATMALYTGSPTSRAFGEFVASAGVTMLGVVPKLVRSWRTSAAMDGLDWTKIRRFSSTGETSDPEEMAWLMRRAGLKPVIEYCGGTEIGGGYITGTMVQPAIPATFSTPALGLDFVILDEDGAPAPRGEVGIVPPSIGLSNRLLNYDHRKEYFGDFPPGPRREVLRRHGDQLERLPNGYFRHHGRMDDTINLNGVKTSVEEIRGVIGRHPEVYDTKPFAIDVEGRGQHVLVVYAVPKAKGALADATLARRLRAEFEGAIKERLNPLLAHVHDVVLVPELPQAGPGKTRTTKEFVKDYRARGVTRAPPGSR